MACERLRELDSLSENPALWENPEQAQALLRERNNLSTKIEAVQDLERNLEDLLDLFALAELEEDQVVLSETEQALRDLLKKAQRLQMESLLSGEADSCEAYLQLNAGAGGTEAQDWALILLRMYLRWAEGRGYKTTILETSDGEEAGIKSATVKIAGHQAYGWLKTETGVHRLVRISPFDSNARRHTSFASVAVSPVIDDSIQITIEDKDLRIDTYRSSGAGGQHVNTTDSAIRITHIPTGIVVACQNERSQHKNKDQAFSMLRAKLYEHELRKREESSSVAYEEKSDIGWGHQIRSYVLHPYQMIKDLRTGVETSNTGGVLDGDLDAFLEAALAQRLGKRDEDSDS